ncbi:MAG TPA: response regulator [bacterium]|nr:response regulator [bacterium]
MPDFADQLEVIERLLYLLGEKERELGLLYEQCATGVPPPEQAGATAIQGPPLAGPRDAAGRVLVVDANASVRVRIANTLLGRRLAVKTAADGIEALEYLRDHRFDMVVFDYQTPRVSPLDFIQVLHRRLPNLHIYVTVNDQNSQLRDRLVALGATGVLGKPVDLARLAELIHLNHSAQASQAA